VTAARFTVRFNRIGALLVDAIGGRSIGGDVMAYALLHHFRGDRRDIGVRELRKGAS